MKLVLDIMFKIVVDYIKEYGTKVKNSYIYNEFEDCLPSLLRDLKQLSKLFFNEDDQCDCLTTIDLLRNIGDIEYVEQYKISENDSLINETKRLISDLTVQLVLDLFPLLMDYIVHRKIDKALIIAINIKQLIKGDQ